MGTSHPRPLLDQLNDSGFPLQIAVEEAVRATGRRHGWRVEGVEAPWESLGRQGWTDVLLVRPAVCLAVECKRMKANWIFARSAHHSNSSFYAMAATVRREPPRVEWTRVSLDPESPEATYCVARSHARGERLQLESIAADLVSAAEGAAAVYALTGSTEVTWVVPVLVTTADLFVADIPPESIPLETGALEADGAVFRPVPVVRFTKALGPLPPIAAAQQAPVSYYRALLRTVLIVRASELLGFFRVFDLVS